MSGELYVGVMSGTSLDGIDIALVNIDQNRIEFKGSHFMSMPESVAKQLKLLASNHQTALQKLGELDHQLGHLYADAVNQLIARSEYSAHDITAIGCHGQTIYHSPNGRFPFTMQIGDANIIAAKTGIQTVSDFRRKDMALGGQGAPLVPAFHQFLFSAQESTLVILNIGGIANVSVIDTDGTTTGFDTGPGNGILDEWCELHTGMPFDKDGMLAREGKVSTALLSEMLTDDYFSKPAPKSTGREYFNLTWLQSKLQKIDSAIRIEDVQRTLVELTVTSIINALSPFQSDKKATLLVCGGGVHNPVIMSQLKQSLDSWSVKTTNEYGIDEDFMEAMAFAWLAYCRVHHLPANLPAVTGAKSATTLGCIYLPE
ncbi:anhydro-N-acetylmuramic acid kinase [Vibrio sp.]|nr:anhydro-N-acetylmuramic acid kinase [Vibrio sp.]